MKLAPGSIITFHADARDFDDLKGPNLGKSRELRLRIVSDEDFARQLDDQRREIREETARILAMQNQAMLPVDDATRTLAADRQAPAGRARQPQERRDDPAPGGQPDHQPDRRPRPQDPPVPRRPEELQGRQPRRPEADGADAGRRRPDPPEAPRTRRAGPDPRLQEPRRRRRRPAPPRRPEARSPKRDRSPTGPRIRPRPTRSKAGRPDQAKSQAAKGQQSKDAASPSSKGGEPAQDQAGQPQDGKADQARRPRPRRPAAPSRSDRSTRPGRGWPRPSRTRRRSPTSSRRCSTA